MIYVGPGGTDNEGRPSFVPIIPSLNKKRVKDAPRSDGDHFKCKTFAELQERLDFIDGSESPEGKESASPPKTHQNSSHRVLENTGTTWTKEPDQERSTWTIHRTSADGDKRSPTPCQPCVLTPSGTQDSEVREKVHLEGTVPKPSASPSRAPPQPPPAGMSQQALKPGGWLPGRSPMEASGLQAALDLDFLRTTVTLRQPVELNGEDELVFTVIDLVPDNGRPSNLLSFNRDCCQRTWSSGSRPVSIISSINDEYDARMSEPGADGGAKRSAGGSWPSEVNPTPSTSNFHFRVKNTATKNATMATTSPNDSSCFSELDSSHGTPTKPDSTKGTLKLRTSTLNQSPHPASHSSLPSKTKLTSSETMSRSRQEGSDVDPRGSETPNSVPGPPRSPIAQRVVDGCERSRGQSGDTLIKLPTSPGTGSTPRSHEGTFLGKKSRIWISKSGKISPAAEQKTRTSSPPSALKTSSDLGNSSSNPEEEFRIRAGSFSHRTSSGLRTWGTRPGSFRYYGSMMSGTKPEPFRENSGPDPGGKNKSGPTSTSSSNCLSQVSPDVFTTPAKGLGKVKGHSSSGAAVFGGSKVRTQSPSKPLDTSSLPPTAKSPARTGSGSKMGTKHAINRVANSRVSELAAVSQRKQLSTPLPSPYSKITAPRRPQRGSSGRGSDNSSVLSGELPPAMGRTALFYHSGASSGYESTIRDGETTGSTSSGGGSSSNRSRASKSPKKRGNGEFGPRNRDLRFTSLRLWCGGPP